MTSPPYLELGFALRVNCAKCARYRKVAFKSKITQECFLNYMLCIHTLSPALFNSKVKELKRLVPRMQMSNQFLTFNESFTVDLKTGMLDRNTSTNMTYKN